MRIDPQTAAEIRRKYDGDKRSIRALAAEYRVAPATIHRVINNGRLMDDPNHTRKLRQPNFARLPAEHRKAISDEYAHRHMQPVTMKQLAIKYKTSTATVYNIIKRDTSNIREQIEAPNAVSDITAHKIRWAYARQDKDNPVSLRGLAKKYRTSLTTVRAIVRGLRQKDQRHIDRLIKSVKDQKNIKANYELRMRHKYPDKFPVKVDLRPHTPPKRVIKNPRIKTKLSHKNAAQVVKNYTTGAMTIETMADLYHCTPAFIQKVAQHYNTVTQSLGAHNAGYLDDALRTHINPPIPTAPTLDKDGEPPQPHTFGTVYPTVMPAPIAAIYNNPEARKAKKRLDKQKLYLREI